MAGAKKLGTGGKKKLKHLGKGLKNRAPAEGARGRSLHGGSMDAAGGKKGGRSA